MDLSSFSRPYISNNKNQRVILVTGANKGSDLEVIRKLAKETSYNNGIVLLRSGDRSPVSIDVFQSDTSSSESISHAIDEIKEKYGGQLDILINNAALWTQELTVGAARELLQTNYYGLKTMNEQFFPLLWENSGVVNVLSATGPWALSNYPKKLQEKFLSSTLTIEQLDRLVEDFISAIETKNVKALGYGTKSPQPIYNFSKVAVNALTGIQARQWSNEKNITTSAACPGFCDTDMVKHAPSSPLPEMGANSILYVVHTPRNEFENGAFYRDGIKKPKSYQTDIDLSSFFEHMKQDK